MRFQSDRLVACQCLVIWLWVTSTVASKGHNHMHHHSQKRSNGHIPTYSPLVTSEGQNQTLSNTTTAESIVSSALAALAVANKQRYQNVQYNKYEFQVPFAEVSSPPPLEYNDGSHGNISHSSGGIERRGSNSTDGVLTYGYTIPAELADAARVVAEAQPPSVAAYDYVGIAKDAKLKYATRTNDTNAMEQAIHKPNGLFQHVEIPAAALATFPAEVNAASRRAVATSKYWMAEIEQNGKSPLAPQGYTVWRNVMDYGAKGDGVTDDTAAINLAISDGGRCGQQCGSSTITPAVVWFPAGTYLVSSSIIQYYNTQFIGDPLNMPTIMAAASFVGLGVITSDVYVGDGQWYINQNNFLRSIKNFRMDITRTAKDAQVCAIHWQVAQGTSLENIEFHMSSEVGTTQQGIYMENGSGGYMADLTFVGGKFGAYLGNQQFTSHHLIFVNCDTAMQIHWDWAWTMQDIVIEGCRQGVVIVGGQTSEAGQSVGSLVLVDVIIANTPTGILTTMLQENTTSLRLQNIVFANVAIAIKELLANTTIMDGAPGDSLVLLSWGFGMVSDASDNAYFVNGQDLAVMNGTDLLTIAVSDARKRILFTRRRPKYDTIGATQIVNVKTMGAKGDGVTDDSAALNMILEASANMSSIVFFPYGVYVIKDTLRVPVGSRIVGQAWSQIMARGSKFEDVDMPYVAVQVGRRGDVGIVEIQDMLFTVGGPTAGAVVVEWNVRQIAQGSAGLWDSHIRVGGAAGSDLQVGECPKQSTVNQKCMAASLLLHLTPTSSAYIENSWIWVADHDLDTRSQDQINVYSARGVLVESQGPTWLYGTTSEHNVMYQYHMSGAKNVLLGMIATESPYFQPKPLAPSPYTTGAFPNDPTFEDCDTGALGCGVSWAVRIIDSSSIYVLGAGLYSWFADYNQDCLLTDDCQQRGLEIEESSNIWLFNIVTKGIVEMVSPHKDIPTYARDNVNGFMSSVLAWLGGAERSVGGREFPGFQLFRRTPWLARLPVSDICRNALVETIECDETTRDWTRPAYRGYIGNETLRGRICDPTCSSSVERYHDNVRKSCQGEKFDGSEQVLDTSMYLWQALNETCHTNSAGINCNNILESYSSFSSASEIPEKELCSECLIAHYGMMMTSPYSYYTTSYRAIMDRVYSVCGKPADLPSSTAPLVSDEDDEAIFCLSGQTHKTSKGDTCDTIALAYNVSSAALAIANTKLTSCEVIVPDLVFCLPLTCSEVYSVAVGDSCVSIEENHSLKSGQVRAWNSWISQRCDNIHEASFWYGSTICLAPQGGLSTDPPAALSVVTPFEPEYATKIAAPPTGATIAAGTTTHCGRWTTATEGTTCTMMCLQNKISAPLFIQINPSLNEAACTLSSSLTYCTKPLENWNREAAEL